MLERVHQPATPGPCSIVFIHGLDGDAHETWMSRPQDRTTLWPVWVGEDSGCDCWVLGYDAALSRWRDAAMPLPDQGNTLLDRLDTRPELKGRQLILVGHSMGGLVIKTAIVNAMTEGVERYAALARRIRGVVFVATPHQGSQLATIAEALTLILRTNQQVGDLAAHDQHLRALARKFVEQARILGFGVRTFEEAHGITVGKRLLGRFFGARVIVVPPGTGDPHIPGEVPISLPADHFNICKPADRDAQIHHSLVDFIRTLPPAPRPMPPAPPPDPAGRAPGRLSGANDNRLQPRETEVLGRDDEIEAVLDVLRRAGGSVAVCAQVTGCGGIGKTEVCKAALRRRLQEAPEETAFYIEVPDQASPAQLPELIGRALGAEGIVDFAQLQPLLRPALYYLDNLESVAEQAEGIALLRRLNQQDGVRLLASSRVDLAGVLGRAIRIEMLPLAAAERLFRQIWSGEPPPDEALRRFVEQDLGRHALSIVLTARLGLSYGFETLQQRWRAEGAALTQDAPGGTRLDSLEVSLRLTSDALASQPGALTLWSLAALFPDGIGESIVSGFEEAGGWAQAARQALGRHHVWQLRGGRFHLLPPVARFALDQASAEAGGFSWRAAQPLAFGLFQNLAARADSIASTPDSLHARGVLLDLFAGLSQLIRLELQQAAPALGLIKPLVERLLNQFQLRPVLSIELLRESLPHLLDLGRANALSVLGSLERQLGRLEVARGLYEQALALHAQLQDGLGQANTLWSLGNLEHRLGRPEAARGLYDRALALYEQHQDDVGQANTLRALGYLERHLGRPEAARGLYDRALALYEQEQDGFGQANTLWSLGDLERHLGRLEAARGRLDQALALYEQEHSGLGQANTHRSLGDLERLLDRPEAARGLYDRALALYQHEQEPMGIAYTWAEMARCHHALGMRRERDAALANAFAAARTAGAEPVMRYVEDVEAEFAGGSEAGDL